MSDYPWQGETAKYVVAEIDEIKRRMHQAESDSTTLRQQLQQYEVQTDNTMTLYHALDRIDELELAVVHTKEVCAESLKRVIDCWREDGVSEEHGNIANAYADFLGGLPPASSWLLRKQADAIDDWLHGEPEMGDLADYADRLRQQADELGRDG